MSLDKKVGKNLEQNLEDENVFGYINVQNKKIPIEILFTANNVKFLEGVLKDNYARVLNNERFIWTIPQDDTTGISLLENGEEDHVNLSPVNLGGLVNRVLSGKVDKIGLTHAERGVIKANIQRALDYALGYSSKKEYMEAPDGEKWVFDIFDKDVNDLGYSLESRRGALKAAMYAMALTGYLNDEFFLKKIKDNLKNVRVINGIESRYNEDLARTVGEVLKQFNQIDEYHSDLPYGDCDTVKSILESKINPKKPTTPEEAFKKGYKETYELKRPKVWLENSHAAKVYYTDADGKRQHKRLGFFGIDNFVNDLHNGKVKDLSISPEDQGKLYASVKRSMDFLLSNNGYTSSSYEKGIFTAKVGEGLFVLNKIGRFNKEEIKKDVSALYDKGKEKLGDLLKKELLSYNINLS